MLKKRDSDGDDPDSWIDKIAEAIDAAFEKGKLFNPDPNDNAYARDLRTESLAEGAKTRDLDEFAGCPSFFGGAERFRFRKV